MHRIGRAWLLLFVLGACGPAAAGSLPAVTTTSPAPTTSTTTTTAAPVVVTLPPTTVPPPPTTTAVTQPRVVTAAPPTTAKPVAVHAGKQESCGWSWDAFRLDDGSINEVSIALDAPRRPNEPVTLTAKPGAANTSTPSMSHATATDGDGQASSKFTLSNDKRDWTITISATFAGGGYCAPQTFTLVY